MDEKMLHNLPYLLIIVLILLIALYVTIKPLFYLALFIGLWLIAAYFIGFWPFGKKN